MRRTIGLLLAGGLAFMVAGCASTGGGGAGTTPAAAVSAGGQASQQTAAVDTSRVARDFNLRVKCPGVHEEKIHGWTDQQIMAQESVAEEDIPACMAWVENQPKGFVPPPPPGYVPKAAPKLPAAPGTAAAPVAPPAAAPATH